MTKLVQASTPFLAAQLDADRLETVQRQVQHIQRVANRWDMSSKEIPAGQSDCLGLCHRDGGSWEDLLHAMLAAAAIPVNARGSQTSVWIIWGMPVLSNMHSSAKPRTWLV